MFFNMYARLCVHSILYFLLVLYTYAKQPNFTLTKYFEAKISGFSRTLKTRVYSIISTEDMFSKLELFMYLLQ